MLTFDQEQRHFFNIAVARRADQHILSCTQHGIDPPTALATAALTHLGQHADTISALLRTAGPEGDPLTIIDFRDNPRLPNLIDGFISRNTTHSVQRHGASRHDHQTIADLSLTRRCIDPETARGAGSLEHLRRLTTDPHALSHMLQRHRQALHLHHHEILAAALDSQEAIILAFQHLISRIARHPHQYGDMLPDDREQEGRHGLIKAMQKFDHRRQNRFASYATPHVTATISRASLKQGHAIYEPERAQQARSRARKHSEQTQHNPPIAISLDAMLSDELRNNTHKLLVSMTDDDPLVNPEAYAERNDLQERVRQILETTLSDTERAIIAMRFGINHPRPYSQYEVARTFGIRDSTVHSIETKALQRFSQHAKATLNDYI